MERGRGNQSVVDRAAGEPFPRRELDQVAMGVRREQEQLVAELRHKKFG